MLITKILLHYSIDLSGFPAVEVSTAYDSKTLSNIGYVLVDNEWYKEESAKEKVDLPKVSKNVANPIFSVLKEVEEIQEFLKSIEEGMIGIQESTNKLLQLDKDTRTNVGKVCLQTGKCQDL